MTTLTRPSAPPPLTPGNRTAVRVLLVIAAAVLVVVCVTALVAAALGLASLKVTTDGKDLPGDTRSLVIDASDVSVRVTSDPGASTARAEVRTVGSSRGTPPGLDVTTAAGETRIHVAMGRGRLVDFGGPSELVVTLPPAVAARLSLTTQQDDGTLTVDANLDRLVARSADGDVILDGAVHVVNVTARDGDVTSRKPLSVTESFAVDSVDGDVAVTFADPAPRRVTATTGSGDVAIGLPPAGPYLVSARSLDTASVDVPETTDPAKAVSEVTVRSDDGTVSVDTRRPS